MWIHLFFMSPITTWMQPESLSVCRETGVTAGCWWNTALALNWTKSHLGQRSETSHIQVRGGGGCTPKHIAAVMDFYVDKPLFFWGWGVGGVTTVESHDSGRQHESHYGCTASTTVWSLSALSVLIALIWLSGHPFLMFCKKIMENTIWTCCIKPHLNGRRLTQPIKLQT